MTAQPGPTDYRDEPIAVTLKELLDVLSMLTDSDEEIVATLLHMVEERRVRLITEPGAEAF